jgi:hypothetical protein
MPVQYWESLLDAGLPWQSVAGTTWGTVTTIGDLSPQPDFTFPANWFYPGAVVRVRANGRYTMGSTATNATWGLYWGATNTAGVLSAGVTLAVSTAAALLVSVTNVPWYLEAFIACRTVGAPGANNGTFMTEGSVCYTTAANAMSIVGLPASAIATAAVDTGTAKSLTLGATLSQVTGAPTITCDHWLIEALD